MKTRLTYEQSQILAECLKRTEQHAASDPPPTWQKAAHELWTDVGEHGPVYSCVAWFAPGSSAERMRYFRALRAVEDAELVEAIRYRPLYAREVVHLKLTDSGEKLARELAVENPTNS